MAFTHLSTVVSLVMPTLAVGIGRRSRKGCTDTLCALAVTTRDTEATGQAAVRTATRSPAKRLVRAAGARTVVMAATLEAQRDAMVRA